MKQASFNLWHEPWLRADGLTGQLESLGIEQLLLRAHELRTIVEISPLSVVGIHRLLVAILQDILKPQSSRELGVLWKAGHLDAEGVTRFGQEFGQRFDLFSQSEPFLQSCDLSLTPAKADRVKTVMYLHPDFPAHGEATHYRHGSDADAWLCPACAAFGLVVQPAFASSGGSGIKPSINGVPPIYVLPQGATLFRSLTASLTIERFQPEVAAKNQDRVWWRRPPVIRESMEVNEVGYLDSLTFACRQMRLHPEPAAGRACIRCGAKPDWVVATMVYQMGESRPKDADLWRDPFVAYRPRADSRIVPVRPQEGRALWRDYGALFLAPPEAIVSRPRVIDQFGDSLGQLGPSIGELLHYRCVGMRTDGKAKIFEWIDQGLDVPFELLHNGAAAEIIRQALTQAEEVGRTLRFVWRKCFVDGHPGQQSLGVRMLAAYWSAVAAPFRQLVLQSASLAGDEWVDRLDAWIVQTIRVAEAVFEAHSDQIGDDAVSLRQRVQAQSFCRAMLRKRGKESEDE